MLIVNYKLSIMLEKDFNNILIFTSQHLEYVNQLLYQILILVIVFIFFENITSHELYLSLKTKIFLIFMCICFIILDWFIWNNLYGTILFTSILFIYICYNFNKYTIISSFIDLTKNAYILQQHNNIIPDSITINSPQNNHIIPIMNFDGRLINADTIKNYTTPNAFDKNKYLNTNILYNSNDKTNIKPYYANARNTIKINDILDNNYSNKTGNGNGNGIGADTIPNKSNISNEELLHSFQNPKKDFLDMTWMTKNRTYPLTAQGFKNPYIVGYTDSGENLKVSTYIPSQRIGVKTPIGRLRDNDNCIQCKLNSNIHQNKNAICTVVPYGFELSSCTNQDNTITQKQLDNISNNNHILL